MRSAKVRMEIVFLHKWEIELDYRATLYLIVSSDVISIYLRRRI